MLTDILMLMEGEPVHSFSRPVVQKYCTDIPSQQGIVNAFNKAFASAGSEYEMIYVPDLEYTIFDRTQVDREYFLSLGV